MKWQQIVDITPEQFNSLTKQELKGYTQILASAGNKRIKRAQEQGFNSPSIDAVLTKGKFSTKDKNLNQLRNEFMRAKGFLQSRTGTLGEFKKWQRENIDALKKEGINITPDQFDTFWRSYEALKKDHPEVANKGLKYYTMQAISQMQKDAPNMSVDEILSNMNDNIDLFYQIQQQQTTQAEEQAQELDFRAALDEITPTTRQETRNDEEQSRSAKRAAGRRARKRK